MSQPLKKTSESKRVFQLPQFLQQRDGKMTRELLLHPGQHGLGMTHESMRSGRNDNSYLRVLRDRLRIASARSRGPGGRTNT